MRADVRDLELTGADADALALGVFADEAPSPAPAAALVGRGEARSAMRALAVTHLGERPLIVVGLGPRDAFDDERARRVAAAVQRRAAELGARTLAWALPDGTGPETADALVTGTALAAYRFDRYRPSGDRADGSDGGDGADGDDGIGGARTADRTGEADADADRGRLTSLTICAPGGPVAELEARVARAALLAAAQNRARDLGNTPANDLTPTALAAHARALADRHPRLTCEVLDETQIIERGMGAFAAVAAGSAQPAALIVLRYDGPDAPEGRTPLALIGKAVTFDSGGLNLKPGPSMIGMKFDMSGGAAVIEAVGALAELAAPVRVLGIVGATENMTGSAAMRPGDVLRALDGTTIEMNNSDAEGRLVLADCIAHARALGCSAIVDVATLTGGAVTALGSVHAALMASDDRLADALLAAGRATGERLWRLPLDPDYAAQVKGRIAQLSNLPQPRAEASAITAAEFLHHFARDTPWAHLDIAGVSDDSRKPYFDKGGTGFGVRLLVELALAF